MKLVLSQQIDRPLNRTIIPVNEVLRLAAEIFEDTGESPSIDVHGAALNHWNGLKISIARADLVDLADSGLLDGDGDWTVYGHRELARLAGVEAPEALLRLA